MSRQHEMPQQPIIFCEVFDVWGIDFIRLFLVSNGYSYILLAVDYMSRWVEAVATKTNDAKKLTNPNWKNWSRHLEDALWVHRTAYRTPLGMSPYWIVFDKAYHLLFELEHRAYWAIKKCNMAYDQAGEERKLPLQELEELCLEAYENSRIYKQRVKQFHDHQILRKEFHVGQKVLLFKSRLRLIAGKLYSKWDGPFIITKVLPYGAIELQDERTRSTFQANEKQLKIFHEGPTTIVGKVESISLAEPAT
ncbi:hypothetical protein CR513_30925, partial [Mucuna pruriens]